MRLAYFLLIGLLAVLLGWGDSLIQGQPPPGRGGRGGRGGWQGRGRGGFDPGRLFDMMAAGKKEIVIAEVTDPRRKQMLERIAKAAGVTNGKLTKEQYVKGMQDWFKQMRGRFNRFGGGGQGGPPPSPPKGGKRGGKGPKQKPGKQAPGQQPLPQQAAPAEQEETKPDVYRAGKLPKGLPAWFQKMDTDNDGQIGLYEWTKAGRPVDDFLKLDRNADGFLTIQEVMRAKKLGLVGDKTPNVLTPKGKKPAKPSSAADNIR
jgi:hypothetical protein